MKELHSHSIKIRPITEGDFEYVHVWSKDEKFCMANEWEINRSEEELYEWWLHCVRQDAKDFIRLGIEHHEKMIGYADLAAIKESTAELGIAIGDSTMWGRGLGFTAMLHTMKYGNENFGITLFTAETHEDNLRSQRMLEKLRFKEVSRKGTETYLGRENQLIQYRLEYNTSNL
ncbi:GNAT family N-acetyltransferase [Oceanobacillus sp. CAU 1775]